MTNFYKKIVNFLTSVEKFHIRLELDRMKKILSLFDNPQDKFKFIHVAGTNGKGSTCAILSSVLQEQGYKTALYSSPHLLKYNERLKINGECISDEELYNILIKVDKKAKDNQIILTEFEILTVSAFLWFAFEKIDVAVVETGLGGRLDATNVVKTPLLSVITSISFDHVDRLGDTIEKISLEKAGIIKENVPCVIGDTNLGLEVVSLVANEKKSPLFVAKNNITFLKNGDKNVIVFNKKSYEFALKGGYQLENLSLVFETLKVLEQNGFVFDVNSISKGLKKVRHIARFEQNKKINIIIDGAHNPDGALALRKSLDVEYPNKSLKFVFACINTKDYKSVLNNLIREEDELFLYDFKYKNAVKAEDIASNIQHRVTIINEEQLKNLIDLNKNASSPIVITGSLYAIGELYANLN